MQQEINKIIRIQTRIGTKKETDRGDKYSMYPLTGYWTQKSTNHRDTDNQIQRGDERAGRELYSKSGGGDGMT